MKKFIVTVVAGFALAFQAGCTQPVLGTSAANPKGANVTSSEIIHLTKSSFVDSIFDYENESQWRYKGELPAIVDFYADWCGPCRMLAPVLEELQKEYAGKLQIYKVDTQKERELSGALGIQSLPTVLFIPKDGKPQALLGFRSKEDLKKIISDFLKVE